MTIYSLDVLLFLFGTSLLFHVQFSWHNYYFLKHKFHHVIVLLKTVWVLHSVLIISLVLDYNPPTTTKKKKKNIYIYISHSFDGTVPDYDPLENKNTWGAPHLLLGLFSGTISSLGHGGSNQVSARILVTLGIKDQSSKPLKYLEWNYCVGHQKGDCWISRI